MTDYTNQQLQAMAAMLKNAGFTLHRTPPPMLRDIMQSQQSEILSAAAPFLKSPAEMHIIGRNTLCAQLDKSVPRASVFLRLVLHSWFDEGSEYHDGWLVIGKACEALLPYFEPPA